MPQTCMFVLRLFIFVDGHEKITPGTIAVRFAGCETEIVLLQASVSSTSCELQVQEGIHNGLLAACVHWHPQMCFSGRTA